MKNYHTIYSFVFIALILVACSGTRVMRVEVLRPALITINQDIKSIALLNRSIPTNKQALESILTGEKPAQDKELSEECMRGLNETLNTSNRFIVRRCEESLNASDPKSLSFGAPLNWQEVDTLCEKYKVEALMVLEYFDTDFKVVNPGATAANAIGNAMSGNVTTFEVRGTATSTAGFRVYYPSKKTILYEDRFIFKKHWTQRSANPAEAVARMIKKNEALFSVSYATGDAFAMNVVPLYFWENRDMYKGKKGNLLLGERMALSKNWQGALNSWKQEFENSNKSKIRAKAAFNIALGHEVLGNLNEAQIWVQKAYVEGGKKTALHYSDIIDYRLREQEKLKEQIEK